MSGKLVLGIVTIFLLYAENLTAQNINLNDSLNLYYSKGNFTKAIFFSQQLVENSRAMIEKKDSALGISLEDLAFLYTAISKYDLAERAILEAEPLITNFFSTNHPEYAGLMDNKARLFRMLGRYSEAESALNKAISIYKINPGKESNEYLRVINNLGILQLNIDNYSAADRLFSEVLSIRKKLMQEQSLDYATAINNLAVVNYSLNNFKEAEELYKQALLIYQAKTGDSSRQTALALGNLSTVYYKIGKFSMADSLSSEVLQITERIYGVKSDYYVLALNERASLYISMGKYKEAENLFLKALSIREELLGNNNAEFISIIGNLGGLYFQKGDDKKAEEFFLQALKKRESVFGKSNPTYFYNLINIANVCKVTGQYDLATYYFTEAWSLERKILIDKLNFLSEKELVTYTQIEDLSIKWFFSTLWYYNSAQLIQIAYNSRLLIKSIAIQNTIGLIQQMDQSKDTVLSNRWKAYKNNKLLLNKLLSQPITKRNIDTDSLNEITTQQEKELLRRSADYRNMKEKLNITWQDVHKNLKPGEAAIEFVKFNYLKRRNTDPDTIYYAAMLLRPQDTVPVFIKLFEEKDLQAALKSFAYKAATTSKILKTNVTSKNNIYTLLWKPLEQYLTETNTIYFSPDGLLHQLAFAAIPYKKGLVCDKYKLVQLTSTRQVAIKEEAESTPASIVLFGGINYNRQKADTATVSTDPFAYVYQQNRSADVDSFPYLPGTLKEIQHIKKGMERRHKTVFFLTGDAATETAFKKIGNGKSPQVIHFATHGFALPDDTTKKNSDNTFKISDNPLLRSGLVMAGGNKGWKGKANPDEEDGILTALEISAVPLQNTQLTVLSACQSGAGELRGSEGVFGLQRAFKIAGVNYVMASLWPVPDKETGEFMNLFYNSWLAGSNIRQAFWGAQQAMHKKYSPYYWAAFMLVQ